MEDLKVIKNEIINIVNDFIDRNEDEFEFIANSEDEDNWIYDEDENCITLSETLSIYVRESDDTALEVYLKDDEYCIEKIIWNEYTLYIMI